MPTSTDRLGAAYHLAVTRLAVFSDIHGNSLALEAVLDDARRLGADLMLNLGDIVSGAADPRGTMDLLYALDMGTVRGNHERNLVDIPRDRQQPSDRYAFDRLTSQDLDWLAALPACIEPADGVLAFHGSPTDDLCYLLETSTPDGLREATDSEVAERLGDALGRWRLYLCGHTHLQRTRRLADGALVVNPGSVGMPAFTSEVPYPHVAEAGTPHARYAVVDDANGSWRAELRLVAYDHEAAALIAQRNGRPDLAHVMRTGRAAA
jgi:predicted phosphodiesterase